MIFETKNLSLYFWKGFPYTFQDFNLFVSIIHEFIFSTGLNEKEGTLKTKHIFRWENVLLTNVFKNFLGP